MKKTIKIPLPYLMFYYLAPGFNGFRAPSRWMALALIGAVAAGVVGLTRLKSFWRGVTASGMIILALVLARPVDPVKAPTVAEAPEVYTWLKFQPPGAVIELPMFRWGSTSANKNEVYRMIYQTIHRMPMVNGYSGFSSPEWEDLVARLQTDFPSDALINELKARGVKYLIIHQDEYQKWFQKRMVIENMKPIYQDNSTMVYGF